jgi:hypothetical protein
MTVETTLQPELTKVLSYKAFTLFCLAIHRFFNASQSVTRSPSTHHFARTLTQLRQLQSSFQVLSCFSPRATGTPLSPSALSLSRI